MSKSTRKSNKFSQLIIVDIDFFDVFVRQSNILRIILKVFLFFISKVNFPSVPMIYNIISFSMSMMPVWFVFLIM